MLRETDAVDLEGEDAEAPLPRADEAQTRQPRQPVDP